LIDYYLERRAGMMDNGSKKPDHAAFRKRFDFMSLQRNLKAAGRFVYIDVVKKKNHLLPYIPQTLGYVRRTLNRHHELQRLRDALQPYVEELRSAP
jgi:aminoglycoside/choline kinase family phosphotransferase